MDHFSRRYNPARLTYLSLERAVLNATLGNAVELIVAIIALVKCEIQVVQSSLLGSILSNLLLVLGMVFFVGGIKYSEQGFKDTAAQMNSSLLVIAVFGELRARSLSTLSATKRELFRLQRFCSLPDLMLPSRIT